MVAARLSLYGLFCVISCGCEAPASRLQVTFKDALDTSGAGIADVRSPGGSVWFVERTQALGAYAVELSQTIPLQFRPHAMFRCFVLRGSVRVRVAGEEKVLGPGGVFVVPRRQSYRVRPLAGTSPRLLMLLMPDSQDAAVIEMPMVYRKMMSGEGP